MTASLRTILLSTALGMAFGSAATADVTIRHMTGAGSISALELADALGYFEGTGISFELLGHSTGGPETLMALASGNADIANPATAAGLNAIASGNDFRMVWPTNGINEQVQSAFYVLEKSPLTKVEDIVGKSVAVNTLGAHLDYTVREALIQKGLAPDAANLVTVPGPQLEQVLRSEQVDVAAFGYWQQTFEGVALENGGLRRLFDDTDVLGDLTGGFALMKTEWLEAHPVEASILIEANAKAADFAHDNIDEARKLIAKILEDRGENPEIAQHFQGYGLRKGGVVEDRDFQFWIDVLERQGKIEKGVLTVENVYYRAPIPAAVN